MVGKPIADKESTVSRKTNGGTKAANIVKVNGKLMSKATGLDISGLLKSVTGNLKPKAKVSTNGKARRAEFIQRYGKAIAQTWAGLTGKSKGPAGVQKKFPELNTWQIDYALVKLGLKKSTSPSMLQWIKDDEVKAPVVEKVKAIKPKMNKALIAREKREAESVERFNASSLPSEVIVGSLRSR